MKKNYIGEIIKKVDMIKSSWKIVNNPFNILMAMIIRQYSIDKKEESLNNSLLYLTLSLYSSLHYKYFQYIPNENVMNYTINNLNNKFLFKQYGVVIKALFHTANKTLEKYEKDLKRGNDEDIVNFLMFLQTRLNNLMKNFTSEYMKNYKSKKYLNTEKDNTDEDNFYETDNVSLMISRLTSQTTNKFYSGDLNDKLIRVSSKFSDVSPITLKYALESIKKNEREKVESLIQSILQVYLIDGKNSYESIASQRFIAYCISIYSKSNTKDVNILRIKKLLDYFLKNNSNKYSETEREATRISYRKAFYMYIVLFIQQNQLKH
ncbi:hypothetical protein DA469_21845 [Bacillus subtilis]|nr:hypothetical protein DA469_21845 [Bacillus subtilis]